MANNSLKCDMVADFTQMSDDSEALTVTCDRNVFAVVYRPTKGNTSVFVSFLDALLGWVNDSGFNVFIGGDINIDMLSASPAHRELATLLETNSCIKTIISPTRIQPSSATLLDVFITNIDRDDRVRTFHRTPFHRTPFHGSCFIEFHFSERHFIGRRFIEAVSSNSISANAISSKARHALTNTWTNWKILFC